MLKYKVSFKQGGFVEEDIAPDDEGGADALVLISIMRNGKPAHSGPVSFLIFTADSVGYQEGKDGEEGEVPEIPDTELFTAMSMMARGLSESKIPEWQRAIARTTFEAVRDGVVARSTVDSSEFE